MAEDKSKQLVNDFLTNNDVLWEEVTLPSRGLYYGSSLPGGVLKVRPWTMVEEKILTTQRLVKADKSFDMIFNNCCKFPDGLDAQQLLVGDRTFLIYYFRGISYGNLYKFHLDCTNKDCGAKFPCEYDLNNLAGSIKWANPENGVEPFSLELPDASKKANGPIVVKWRFTRAFDIKDMDSTSKLVSKGLDSPDDTIEKILLHNIVSINNIEDRSTISKVLLKLTAKDVSYLRETINSNSPTIDPQVVVDCPKCGNHMEVDLPFKETFFRYTG